MKKCKGTGRAKGFGCGVELSYSEHNGIKSYKSKYGLGIDCGCFYNFDFNYRLKNIDETLNKNVAGYKSKKIAPRSKKRIAQEKIYSQLRKAYLNKEENKICPITNERTTTVHHKKGRIGGLLIDTKYWVALSMDGHIFVEQNPKWAKENGYSLSRLEK